MIVSIKEPSVRPLLKKRYVFNYPALSEIWIWKTLLRQLDSSNLKFIYLFFAVCWLIASSGDSWNGNASNNSCWSDNSSESLQKMVTVTEDGYCNARAMGVAFWLKIKMGVMGNIPFPHFHWCISSIQFSFPVCTSGCGRGWGDDVSCGGSQFVSGRSSKPTAYLFTLEMMYRKSRCMSCKSTVISKLDSNWLRV